MTGESGPRAANPAADAARVPSDPTRGSVPVPFPLPVGRPLLVWDGDCGFCRRWATWIHAKARGRLDLAPYQRVGDRFPGVGPEDYRRAVHLFENEGALRWTSGAEAVLRALALGGGSWAIPARLYRSVPGLAALLEWGYGIVARHRMFFSRWAVPREGGRRP